MDVGRLAADGVDDQRVDVTDDRGVVLLDVPALRQLDGEPVALGLAEDVGVGDVHLTPAVATCDRRLQGVGRRELGVDRELEHPGKGVEGLGVEGVRDRDQQFDPVHLERQEILALGLLPAHELQEILGRGDLGDIDDLHVELEAQSLGDGGPGDLPSLDQFGQGGGVGVLPLRDLAQLGPRFGDLGRGHETLVLDELDDEIVGGRHGREIQSEGGVRRVKPRARNDGKGKPKSDDPCRNRKVGQRRF